VSKIGRNDRCPCGSGKKYKRCHGAGAPTPPSAVDAAIQHSARIALMRHQARQKEIETQFGLGRPPISLELNGYKLVAVGPEIHWSKKWKTFPDFLMDYFKKEMGSEWGQAELAKPREEWHPLFYWYVMTCEYQKKVITTPGQPISAPMIGAACGILWLTYGLYLLRHNAEIQLRLLQRLRATDPVQIFGALQEIIIAAAMIRSGFELELENEADGSETHCEFTATSKITRNRFSVEVKVCNPGRPDEDDGRARTIRQLAGALAKTAKHPRIVCIDLNQPVPANSTIQYTEQVIRQEMQRIRRAERYLKTAPPAYIVLSNFPFRFDLEGTNYPRAALLEGFKIPRLSSNAPFTSLRELSEFNAEHADPSRFLQTLVQMKIPDTLDGELPSRAFGGEGPLPPILIGERYLVPDADGREVPGEMVSAVMVEDQMKVMAVVRLDSGNTIIVTMPITERELNAYKESPETFFGTYEPKAKVGHPVELYEFMLETYRQTPRERLLELLAEHAGIESLRELPQLELAKIYSESMAYAAVARNVGRQR
jgi:SEC-C motif